MFDYDKPLDSVLDVAEYLEEADIEASEKEDYRHIAAILSSAMARAASALRALDKK